MSSPRVMSKRPEEATLAGEALASDASVVGAASAGGASAGGASAGGASAGGASAANAADRESHDSRLKPNAARPLPHEKPLPHQEAGLRHRDFLNGLAKYIWVVALALSFLLTACDVLARELSPAFESRDATLFHDAGVVHRIDYGAHTALIGGLEYHFVSNARVQINGKLGAWSMLVPDMKVDFIYIEEGPTRRTIVELYQLPARAEIEGY